MLNVARWYFPESNGYSSLHIIFAVWDGGSAKLGLHNAGRYQCTFQSRLHRVVPKIMCNDEYLLLSGKYNLDKFNIIQSRELILRSFDSFWTTLHGCVSHRSVRWLCVKLGTHMRTKCAYMWMGLLTCAVPSVNGSRTVCCKLKFVGFLR